MKTRDHYPRMTELLNNSQGLRERKKQETLLRIAETGLDLFLEHGFDGTTLEQIAAKAGISRRTFFHYYKSKEEILMAFYGGGYVTSLPPAIRQQSNQQSPLSAVYNALLHLMTAHESPQAIKVDRILRTTESLKSRSQAAYIEMENATFEALCELYPEPEKRESLRVVAMVALGAMRLAKAAWSADEGKKPLRTYLKESFAALGEIN